MTPQLSQADREHFLQNGFVVVQGAVPADHLAQWQDLAWQRLGYDRDDAATWDKARVHLPPSRAVRVAEWAPRAQAAMEEVCGANRLLEPNFWADVFIANLGEGADRPFAPPAPDGPYWHKDGGFFQHYLDSPEQALLVLVAWTDVQSQGGATFIAPDSIEVVARYLANHPEGVRARPETFGALIHQCRDFREVTAQAGDVVLCHPFLLHAVGQNVRRVERIISNPIVMLQEPMNFNRADGDYSLVEQTVLRALGKERFDFRRTTQTQSQLPGWVSDTYQKLRAHQEIEIGQKETVA